MTIACACGYMWIVQSWLGQRKGEEMLIYLDANIVQYCVPWEAKQPPDPKLEIELQALCEIIELAAYAEVQDLDHRWDVAAPKHLIDELERGRPTIGQLRMPVNSFSGHSAPFILLAIFGIIIYSITKLPSSLDEYELSS